jgi:hypothetical protein
MANGKWRGFEDETPLKSKIYEKLESQTLHGGRLNSNLKRAELAIAM